MYTASTFYANFQLYESVRKDTSRSGQVLAKSGGGGGGGGSSPAQKDIAYYSRQESSGYSINPADRKIFDEAEFMKSLRRGIEQDIIASGANVTETQDLDETGFNIEYAEENIKGRIGITAELKDGSSFNLLALLWEESTSEKKPRLINRKGFVQPHGIYYAVPFRDRVSASEFFNEAKRITDASMNRARQQSLTDKSLDPFAMGKTKRIIMYSWSPLLPEHREAMEAATGETFDILHEYDEYSMIYFINEAARQMFEENGESSAILESVSAETVALIPFGPSFGADYLPINEWLDL